jgi:hypothetical protein
MNADFRAAGTRCRSENIGSDGRCGDGIVDQVDLNDAAAFAELLKFSEGRNCGQPISVSADRECLCLASAFVFNEGMPFGRPATPDCRTARQFWL